MLQNYDKLISHLAAAKCSGDLADKLRSRGLISDGVYEAGVHAAAMESTRIRALIHAVDAEVKLNTRNYYKFVTILRELAGLEDIVETLQGTNQ